MDSPDRRDFLASSLFAGAGAALPAWLARWFGTQDPAKAGTDQGTKAREKVLRAAVQQAKDQGKPLLVFVMPADAHDGQRWYRGQWFGAFLNHGGAVALLEVALCVPACATLDDVRAVTGAAPIAGNPLLLVVDVGQVGAAAAPPPKVTALTLDLGDPIAKPGKVGARAMPEEFAQNLADGIETLTKELHRTIHTHGGTMGKLCESVRTAMTEGQRTAIAEFVDGGKVPADDLLVRATAIVRSAAAERPDDKRKRLLDALGAAAERVLVKQRMPGGLWRRSEGCGTATEDESGKAVEVAGIACGMGMVPKQCQRFLDLYTVP